jgi:hypothetical protein
MMVVMPRDLHREFKRHCAFSLEISMTGRLLEMVRQDLARQTKTPSI